MAKSGDAARRELKCRENTAIRQSPRWGMPWVRKTLVECTQALVKGNGKKSKALKKRQKGQDDASNSLC